MSYVLYRMTPLSTILLDLEGYFLAILNISKPNNYLVKIAYVRYHTLIEE